MTRCCCCTERFLPPRPTRGLNATRNIELTLVSADHLPNFRYLSGRPMRVYAEVSLNGGAVTKSDVDIAGGDNPTWNFTVRYAIPEPGVHNAGVILKVRLLCERSLRNSLIGSVEISVKNLFDLGLRSKHDLGYSVNGTLDGKLMISYSFGCPNL